MHNSFRVANAYTFEQFPKVKFADPFVKSTMHPYEFFEVAC